MLIRLKPKGKQSVAPFQVWGTRTYTTAGVEAGAKSFVLLKRNMINPLFSSLGEESGPQGSPMGQRVGETGTSKGRPVIEQIGIRLPRESGLTKVQ